MHVCRVIKQGCFLKLTFAPIWFPHWPTWRWTISLIVTKISLSLSFQQRFSRGLRWVCLHAWIFKSQQKKRASYVFSTRMVFTILSLVSLTNFLQSYFNKKCVGRLITRQLVSINKWTFLLTEKPDFWVSWFCGFSFWFLFQLDSRSILFCNVIQ